MRIILCDDDTQFMQSFSKQLFSILQKHGVIPKVILTHTGLDALREITHQPTDVLFLDIDMPQQDGFSVATELTAMENKPLIIFLSSLDHLVYQSFAFQPFWFLRKSHLEDLPTKNYYIFYHLNRYNILSMLMAIISLFHFQIYHILKVMDTISLHI